MPGPSQTRAYVALLLIATLWGGPWHIVGGALVLGGVALTARGRQGGGSVRRPLR